MTVAAAASPAAPPSPFAVFRRRDFSLMWVGQLVSTIGSSLTSLAASILIFRLTNSAMSVGLMLFLVSAVCILLLRVRPLNVEEGGSVATVFRNLKAGMRTLFGTPILRSLFFLSVPVLAAFGLSNALLLPFALRALEATEFEYGLQEGLTSVGFVAGSLLMAGLAGRMREGQWMTISFIGMGLAGVAYSRMSSVPLAIGILIVSGFLNAPSSIARRLVIQRNTPREMRGRVNSAFFVSRDVLFLVGMAAAGLADLDRLAGRLPSLSGLSARERESLIARARVLEAPAGTTILRHGETGDSAYFLLSGRAAAGIATPEGGYRSLSTMEAGDFFGEIAALTGSPRTATVVADGPASLLQVPAGNLRGLMANPAISQLFLSKMTERLVRTRISDLPRFAGYDQGELRDLRTAAEPAPAA